jgi:hypothetical protein
MTVRAKFKVDQIERNLTTAPTGALDENGHQVYAPKEVQTVVLSPVYGNGDPNHENSKFWAYTPSGQVRLGTVNGDAASYFELGKEYYLDFTKAE